MDWGMVGAVSVVVGGIVGAATAWLNTQMENKIMKSEQRTFERINGAYIRKELFQQYVDGVQEQGARIERRYDKVETDMGHMQESIGRLTARLPMPE